MAKKRKGRYEPPVGQRPVKRKEGESRLLYLAECFRRLRTWIPLAFEPETLTWSDPLEAKMKERAEKYAIEERHRDSCRKAFRELLSTWQWPELPEDAAFVMNERLIWGERLCRHIEELPRSPSTPEFPLPKAGCGEVMEWILFDLYDADLRVPKKWWDSSSFEDYYDM